MKGKCFPLILVLAFLLMAMAHAWAAETTFPTRPIEMWVAFPPGGPVDTFARGLCSGAEKILGKPIIIENKPGGGGALAVGLLKNVKPDGYTLVANADTALTRTPHLIKVNYDPFKDFTFLIRAGLERSAIVVKSESPFKKYKDIIDFARKNPGQLTIGLSGYGTAFHIGLEKIARIENVKFQYVFFSGAGPITTALLGGHIMVGNMGPAAWLSHYRAGTLKPLLRWEEEPWDEVSDVPSQVGIYNLKIPMAHMIFAPKGLAKPVEDKLVAAFTQATMTPQFQNLARQQQLIAGKPLTGEALNKWVQSTYTLLGTLIKELDIKAEPQK